MQKDPRPAFKPKAFLLKGNNCSTMQTSTGTIKGESFIVCLSFLTLVMEHAGLETFASLLEMSDLM